MISFKKIFYSVLLVLLTLNVSFSLKSKNFLVMINPAGHAKNVGRRLTEGFERGETFRFATLLRNALIEKYGVRVVLTRSPGEEVGYLQSASFSNRMNADFYISLNIYKEASVKPKLFVFYRVNDSLTDFSTRRVNPLSFIPLNGSHIGNIQTTVGFCGKIKKKLSQTEYKSQFDFFGPIGFPMKSLVGVTSPAIGIEVGICQERKLNALIGPIVDSFSFLGVS